MMMMMAGPRGLLLLLCSSAMLCASYGASPATIFGEVGEQIILPCSSVGDSKTKVAWFLEKSSQELLSCDENSSSDFRFQRDSVTSSSLVINNLRLEDGGNYGCKDCSQTTESKPHIQLNVTSGPHNVTFWIFPVHILPNGTLYTSVGSTISFSCSTRSIPQSKMNVYLYASNRQPELFQRGNGSIDYDLVNIGQGFDGNYTCSAENSASGRNVSSTLQLLVYREPNLPIQCSANNTESPSEISVLCTWSGGYPDPVLVLEQDGRPLFNKTSNILSAKLNVSEFSADQTLICRGKHQIGEDVKEDYCHINLSPPVPQSQPLRSCLTGQSVTLSCSVNAYPSAKITWLRNLSIPEVEVQPGKKYQIIQHLDVSYLTIVNCSHEDEGNYICKAENGLGIKDLYIWLSVTNPHNIIGLVSALLILFLLVVGLITGLLIYCDPWVYWKANPLRSGQSEVLTLVESEEEEDDMEQTGNPTENGHYSDTVARSPNPPAANGNIYKHEVLFHQPPASISPDLVIEVSEAEILGEEL